VRASCALVGVLLATAAHASPATPLVLGETFRLKSEALREERIINVYLPPGYSESGRSYPVLLMPDGGMNEDFPHVAGIVDISIKNEVILPMVIVGIRNTERRRDLVGKTSVEAEKKIAPHAGGTDAFRKFLRDELKPEIAARYRVTGECALIGESFAGLFVLETLLKEPELCDAYVAIDPSVWWNGGALVKSASEQFAHWTAKPKRLYVATADHKETQDGVAALMAAWRERKPPGLTATHETFPDQHHNTIFPVAETRAYRVLFAVPKPPR
jgi:predicted alpha/beta superfamily hydrolase